MSNFDDIFDAPKAQESAYQPDAFDKEAWAAKKQAERSSAYELIDRTAEDAEGRCSFGQFFFVLGPFQRYEKSTGFYIGQGPFG